MVYPKFFNTAGPCDPDDHYMLPASTRLPEVYRLVAQKAYFVLHAPRQTGKTTTMLALARELTKSGTHVSALLSLETGATYAHDPGTAAAVILSAWERSARWQLPPELRPPPWPTAPAAAQIGIALNLWAEATPRPLALFLDEIDALQDEALVAILRQLRDGYPSRPNHFPASIALIGLRDVRDYRVAAGGGTRLGTASPFNIKVTSLTLGNFNAAEVVALYEQHTAATGQVFSPEATARAFWLTQGQPWLVNALAKEAVEQLAPDPATPITEAIIDLAKERLIDRQDTHLDSLAERLREPRVRAIIGPILAGTELGDVPLDDLRFVQDLGLCRLDPEGGLVIANPIYREVLPRVLASAARASLPHIAPTWLTTDGAMDTERLLEAFLVFWRQHGQPLLRTAPYPEIAPHLVLMAFLHRVINGGGTLEREYAVGSRRMDLCLRYGAVTLGIELKVWRDRDGDPLREGLEQLDAYLQGLGLLSGWLVIFDQRAGQPPIADRTSVVPITSPAGRAIMLVRA